VALVAVGAVATVLATSSAVGDPAPLVGNNVFQKALNVELGSAQRAQWEQLPSSGIMYALLQQSGILDQRARASGTAPKQFALPSPSSPGTQGCQNTFTGGGAPANIRVNQDCSLRRQAEEAIAINPTSPNNVIAGQNDSRIGFNHCGYDWSFNGGRSWGDQVPPFYQFTLGDGHLADACSDPTVTFDANGNAYAGGVLFDVAAAPSAVVVTKSNAGIGGAFWHSPDATNPFQLYSDNPLGVVSNDTDPNIANDKELMIADSNPSSPKANNVYMTWTLFNAATGAGVGANSPIFFSQSTDGGATWSPRVEISGQNGAVCTVFSGEPNPNACDQDQGSDPTVGPDGTVYVSFGNGNTPTPGVNQHLVVSCPASADCSNAASWTRPHKIADDFGTQPVGPDPVSGCPAGRQCLPPNGYRLDDFVEGAISVDAQNRLYFTWADFRNGGAPCTGSNPTPPCDNDVFYAFSTDRGRTWSAPVDLTPASRFGKTAQWMPWSAVTKGGKLFVAYYDRSNGACETMGCNDITLATVTGAASQTPSIAYRRITTSSMPNLTVANNPVQAGFLGDYMWVAVAPNGQPYVTWADTRGLNGTVEEDIYMAKP
jgi:hypothetical protein